MARVPTNETKLNDNTEISVAGSYDVEASSNDGHEKLSSGKDIRKPTVLESHGYALGRTIGAGSYATVKIAKSDRHECHVAVKIVSKFQAPEDYLKKFLPREIQVVKGLKHPHLIRFLQAIETTHRVYIIMEFAHNGSLLDVICRDVFIDEPRSRRWLAQLTDAVDYCHERGVVHRDIKCENLLMDQDYNIKLSDFGFARGHMKPKNGVAQLSETFCGSYAYASPEILRGIPYQPQLSDAWSLGVVLYTMVYGCLPFDDTNYAQLLKVRTTRKKYRFSALTTLTKRKNVLRSPIDFYFVKDRNLGSHKAPGVINDKLENNADQRQVQNKVTFPKVPKTSNACRSLITRILTPQRYRLKIANIRADPWLAATSGSNNIDSTEKSWDNMNHNDPMANESKATNPKLLLPSQPIFPEKVAANQPKTSNVAIQNTQPEVNVVELEKPTTSSEQTPP